MGLLANTVNPLKENSKMATSTIRRYKRLITVVILILVLVIATNILTYSPQMNELVEEDGILLLDLEPIEEEKITKWWERRKNMTNLSELGKVLFQYHEEPNATNSRNYKILVWKYGPTIENRHLKQFSGQRIDPFEYCPVKNCNITYEDKDIETADIVIFHLHRTTGLQDIPKRTNLSQIWAFLTDESPYHTFLNSKNKLQDFNNLFNWSMTYRSDSHIPVPYGRTVLRKVANPISTLMLNKRRDVLVAIMGSNCQAKNHRWQYVNELKKYISVDVYGGCGPMKDACPGHFGADCPALDNYLFYLSFENTNCNEYITEKLWWNAYHKDSIPIIMGSNTSSNNLLFPLDSYINVDDFAHPRALADHLLHLNRTEEFRKYYNWKKHFEILNEHGYFKSRSYHYCRICQALNYNTKETHIYTDLEDFWSEKRDCHPAWDQQVD